uniref:Uncharacterized protein n=2 Tax=Clytia hemisphaerica TaxID=252671 RepID=A0A7M5UFW8_9CNID
DYVPNLMFEDLYEEEDLREIPITVGIEVDELYYKKISPYFQPGTPGISKSAQCEDDDCDQFVPESSHQTPEQFSMNDTSTSNSSSNDPLDKTPVKKIYSMNHMDWSPSILSSPMLSVPTNLLDKSPTKSINATRSTDEGRSENAVLMDRSASNQDDVQSNPPKKVRTGKVCPLCGATDLQNLPRHLRSKKHSHVSHEESLKISHSTRKSTSKKTPKLRICAFPGCGLPIQNMSHHLRGKHRMERSNTNYLYYLKNSRPAVEGKQIDYGGKQIDYGGNQELEDIDTNDQLDVNGNQSTRSAQNSSVHNNEAPLGTLGTTEAPKDQDLQQSSSKSATNGRRWTAELQKNFYTFLCGPDGGRKEPLTAKQISEDVARIVTCINAEYNISRLFEVSAIRDEYLANTQKMRLKGPADKELRAATIRKYLMSLIIFYTYVIIEKISIDNVEAMDVLNLKMRAVLWRKAYSGEEKEQILAKNSDDTDYLVTDEQVTAYEDSELAKQAMDIFKRLRQNNAKLSQREFCAVRDHLFTRIHFSNACRSGVTANMTVQEFEKAKVMKDG